jgi:alpha-D-xyloside xylohydrolase
MRGLTFDFRNDPNVYNIPDQYMFGPAFLVNPVTQQLYSGAPAGNNGKSRKVYLPKTSKWFNFWSGEILNGGQTIDAQAPIETMPLYVKAGSIIPMGPNVEYATQKSSEAVELRIYPGADGEFKFYQDEDDNYNYEKGKYATFILKWNDKLRQLTISDRKGTFIGMPQKQVFHVVLVKPGHGANIDITSKVDKIVNYQGKTISIKI